MRGGSSEAICQGRLAAVARHSRVRFTAPGKEMVLCCRLASPPISLSEARRVISISGVIRCHAEGAE